MPRDSLMHMSKPPKATFADLARLPEELQRPFAEEVVAQAGDPLMLDYVRLNIEATAESA